MCLMLSVLMLVVSYKFYDVGNLLASGGSLLTAIFFIWLMVKNIQRVKKLRKEKEGKNVD